VLLRRTLTRRNLAILAALAGAGSSAWWDALRTRHCLKFANPQTSLLKKARELVVNISSALNEIDVSTRVEREALKSWRVSWAKSARSLEENLKALGGAAATAPLELSPV
jgi:hypothetical protein